MGIIQEGHRYVETIELQGYFQYEIHISVPILVRRIKSYMGPVEATQKNSVNK